MLAFIVPVKSKKVTADWEIFSQLVERTLRSITNQTSDEYFVVVVCHERPELLFEHPKVIFQSVEFDPPPVHSGNYQYRCDLREADKSQKIMEALKIPSVADSDFVMVVDSDDMISNKIAGFVASHKTSFISGWFADSGYLYFEGEKVIWKLKKGFNQRCGTCQIIKPDILPLFIDYQEGMFLDHKRIQVSENILLQPLPFPSVIYSMANGENIYMSKVQIRILNRITRKYMDLIRSIIRKSANYFPNFITSRFRKEFGFYRI